MVAENKNSKLKEYKYALIVGFGAFFGILIAIFLIGRPLLRSYQESSRILAEKKAIVVKLEKKLVNLKALKEKEPEIKEKNQKVLAAIPTNKDVARLFVQFENIANQNGLAINSVQENKGVGAVTTAGTVPSKVPTAVNYSVSGIATNYDAVKKALSSLETALRILNISEVDINGQNPEGLNVNLKVNTYVRSE